MPTALAISPHLDDAIFSAGGTLAGLARDGWRIVVATVFTASVPDPRGFALACQLDKGLSAEIDYMAVRRGEDAVACAAIGAEPRWLPFAEAPHRGYHSAQALFAGLHAEDEIVDVIAPALSELIDDTAPDLVLSPQAIGAHVDHVAVFQALCSCERPRWLWADFPYLARNAARTSPFAGEFGALVKRQLGLPADDAKTKADAMLAYASQISFQFGGTEVMREAIDRIGRIEGFAVTDAAAVSANAASTLVFGALGRRSCRA